MPVAYYLIPTASGPYSVTNRHRPLYVVGAGRGETPEVPCAWTGHPVDALGYWVVKVDTTEANHTALAAKANVRQLPRNYTWDTVISTMPAVARNAISNWCTARGIAYDSTETIGQFLMRVIQAGIFNLGNTTQTTQFQSLTQARQDAIRAICERLGQPAPSNTETVRQIVRRLGPFVWNGPDLTLPEYTG
jgi:hypothetical protein